MQGFFLKERGIYYRCNEFDPARPTLIFVHGASGSSSAWRAYERDFEKDHNVLSLDLRGHGRSFRPKKYADYAIYEFSEDIHELLRHLHISKCILIGHSFGSIVILDFMGRHRDEASAVIFVSPHYAVGKMWAIRLIKPLLMLAVAMKPELSSSAPGHSMPPFTGGHVDYSKYVNTGDWNMRRALADTRNTGWWPYLYALAQTWNFDGEKILETINVPTLVVHGSNDTVFPLRYGRYMAKTIPNAKLVVLDGVNHIVVLNQIDRTIAVIRDFLKTMER